MQNLSKNIIAESWGGDPPPRCNIFWQILHTFCLLFNLFWTFPLKSIGFLRFQLIFRWFFNDFSGFSGYFQAFLHRLCGRPKNYKNPPLTSPHKNLLPWDHAQMIERKILYKIALTRAPYDQIRPWFFLKYFSDVDPLQYRTETATLIRGLALMHK